MLTLDAAKLRLDQLIFRGITLKGFWLSDRLNRMPLKERESLFGTLIDLLSKGVLNTRIAPGEWGIDDIAAAIRYAEQPNRAGKVVVFPHGTGILTSPPGTMVA
jgi:NADPH:quinone reductase-like Zn-dependent oxidoreductase